MTQQKASWFVCARPRANPKCRVFCFAHAGGAASLYSLWPRYLPEDIELQALQLPGRETRLHERPLAGVSEAARLVAGEILPLLDRPFAFFGHSLGAYVAFELARMLRVKGVREPSHLFVSAARAPHLPEPFPPLSHLPNKQFLEEISSRYGGIPQEVLDVPELTEIVLNILRADFEMSESYRYVEDEPLPCFISVFGGDADYLKHQELADWSRHTTGGFELTMFAGGHFYIQQHSQQIARAIADRLKQTVHGEGKSQ